MKHRVYGLLLPLALLLCLSAWAADDSANVAGNWQLSWQGHQGSQQGTLALQQNGSSLTGTMQGQRGSAPVSGTINGNNVSFNVEMKGEHRSMTLAFTGTINGDKMSGTFQPQGGGRGGRGGQSGEQGDHTWSATRQSGNSSGSDQPGNPN